MTNVYFKSIQQLISTVFFSISSITAENCLVQTSSALNIRSWARAKLSAKRHRVNINPKATDEDACQMPLKKIVSAATNIFLIRIFLNIVKKYRNLPYKSP